ncbi:MAG TPA: lysylphosphatidylglycerol synthase transmembrane domain-containing protein [Parvularculaceae bacterium]|nr:lysylphosphatidylglycerol synthase transmembrane domain-containing protein [Parvularculaceae bacterium]
MTRKGAPLAILRVRRRRLQRRLSLRLRAEPAAGVDEDALSVFQGEPAQTPRDHRMARRLTAIVAGIVGLAGVVTLALHAGEVGAFAAQAERAEPGWIAFAILAQIGAFSLQAYIWRLVLVRLGHPQGFVSLFSLSVGKLFADQTLPSAGISGAVFIIHALTKRGAPQKDAAAAFIFGAASFLAAFAIAVLASFTYVAVAHASSRIAAIGAAGGAAALALIFVSLLLAATVHGRHIKDQLLKRKWLARGAALLRYAADTISSEKRLFARAVFIQIGQRLCDAATLWLAFFAIGEHASFAACLVGISLASIAATIAPTPMGVGSFEGALLATLTALGSPLEAALTSAMLYRGLSLWLPLGLGFFIVQHELLRRPSTAPAYAMTRSYCR